MNKHTLYLKVNKNRIYIDTRSPNYVGESWSVEINKNSDTKLLAKLINDGCTHYWCLRTIFAKIWINYHINHSRKNIANNYGSYDVDDYIAKNIIASIYNAELKINKLADDI